MTLDPIEQLRVAERLLAVREAHDDLLKFMLLTMPDPDDPDNPLKSQYEVTPLSRLLCQVFEQVEQRKLKRVAVSVGPQMGKSQITSRGAPAWMYGRRPTLNTILGTYSQTFAEEFGDDVRNITASLAFKQVFEGFMLRKAAQNLLITNQGGKFAFVGREGAGSGKPADIFIVDDPIKDDVEAQSPATRNQVWNWFNKVAMTRCHGDSAIVIVHTRWHQDDLIGRLCDPEHPERDKKYAGVAEKWTYINLPAVVEEPKLARALGLSLDPPTNPFVISMFGTKPMTSIWPKRKPLEFLAEAKNLDRATFSALYMGQPTPEDGDYFKASDIVGYSPTELPKHLNMYGASDHAVSLKQSADYTCAGTFGVDEHDNIWVMPDLIWDRVQTHAMVERMIKLFKSRKPLMWFLEEENIAKSFGPFLRARMREAQTYTAIVGMRPAADKSTRARSIQGRTQQKMLFLPKFAPWYQDAVNQMLRFPNGTHDDFVDFISLIGMGLDSEVRKRPPKKDDAPRKDTVQSLLANALTRASREQRTAKIGGW